ncbi:MAG: hypothetical protein KME04_15915 [Pleurocapsa minor GSE-CHR-MK-17-07R]|jgi:hypothetical protein|nr:hypothetical protein [Pleurocapsa minor GSE-CHR-MK 17-07R]
MIDPNKDYTKDEQLALDLTTLFDDGLVAPDGQVSEVVRGIGTTAAAHQAIAAGVPLAFIGLALTNARENTLETTRAFPEDIMAEIDNAYPRFAAIMYAGLDACGDEQDYRAFVQWLEGTYIIMRSIEEHGP